MTLKLETLTFFVIQSLFQILDPTAQRQLSLVFGDWALSNDVSEHRGVDVVVSPARPITARDQQLPVGDSVELVHASAKRILGNASDLGGAPEWYQFTQRVQGHS